jgi:toluene monooxygenase system ferredoxin subunit
VAYAFAAPRKDLWQGELLPVTVLGRKVILVEVGGEVRAYADVCPHLGVPLSCGRFAGETLTCRLHEWTFDVKSGEGINPKTACLVNFPVRVQHGLIYIDLGGTDGNA